MHIVFNFDYGVSPDAIIGITLDIEEAITLLSIYIFDKETSENKTMYEINDFLYSFSNNNHLCDYKEELIGHIKIDRERLLHRFRSAIEKKYYKEFITYTYGVGRYIICDISSKFSLSINHKLLLAEKYEEISIENDKLRKRIAQLECEPYRGEEFFKMLEEEKMAGLLQK